MQTPELNHQELSVLDLLDAFRRHRRLFFGVFGTVLLLAILFCVVSSHRYEATGIVEVGRGESAGLDPQSLSGNPPSTADALQADIDLQTQAKILQSNVLALRTIDALKLGSSADYQSHGLHLPDPLSWFKQTTETPEQREANFRAKVLRTFHTRLSVKADSGTRLLEVSYVSGDAQMAADVVNQLVQELTNYGYEQRLSATVADSKTLSDQLDALRDQSEQLAGQVAMMQSQAGVYSLGETDAQGREQSYSSVLDQFQHATEALNEAEQNRILKQAIANAAQTSDAELLSSLAGSSPTGGGSSIINSLATIESLRTQEATLQGQLDQLKAKFGPGYPSRQETEASIRGIDKLIAEETERIRERAKNDAQVADQMYGAALQNYNALKGQAQAANSKTDLYMITKQEADASRSLYEDLLGKLNEAGILEQLHANHVTLIDPAIAPVSRTKPPYPLIVAGGFGGGICLAILAVLFANIFDDHVHGPVETETLGITVLGLLPVDTRESSTSLSGDGYIEAIQALQSRLMVNDGKPHQTIFISGGTPKEKQDAFCETFAGGIAEFGSRVLLIEADLRHPTIAERFGFSREDGLTSLLAGKVTEAEAIKPHPGMVNLHILPAGPTPASSTEMFASNALRSLLRDLKSRYDLILLAGPAALSAPAAASILAELADITVQMTRMDSTTQASIKRANELLTRHSSQPVGVVFMDVDGHSRAFTKYYGSTAEELSAMGV